MNYLLKKITLFNNTYSEIILCCMTNRGDYNLLIKQTFYPLHLIHDTGIIKWIAENIFCL